jgi:AraC-like DNA-binding protein
MGKNTKAWLAEQRQCQAVQLLCDGFSIKEPASCLSYKQPANFAHKYKNHWGICLSLQPPTINPAQTKNVCK